MEEILGEVSVERQTILNLQIREFLQELNDILRRNCIPNFYFMTYINHGLKAVCTKLFYNMIIINQLEDNNFIPDIEKYIYVVEKILKIYEKICRKYDYLLNKNVEK